MRLVLQRVSRAAVTVRSPEEEGGGPSGPRAIGAGLCLLVGFTEGDTRADLEWMARKVIGLRVFPDEDGRMNLSLEDVGGSLLVVSQFTLYGDARKGRRPSFVAAAGPDVAMPHWESFLDMLEARAPGRVRAGEFGAMMDVELVNDGPVTLILERGGDAEPDGTAGRDGDVRGAGGAGAS